MSNSTDDGSANHQEATTGELVDEIAEGIATQREVIATLRKVSTQAIENEDAYAMKACLRAAIGIGETLVDQYSEFKATITAMALERMR